MKESQLQNLRKKAMEAIERNDLENSDFSEAQKHSIDQILEELRIYQAELEIQNQSLRAIQVELEASQALYQSLFDHMPMAAVLVDARGVIQQVNQQAMQLLAFPKRNHLINHSLYRFFNQESNSWLAQVMSGLNHNLDGQPLTLYTADGSETVAAYMVSISKAMSEPQYLLLLSDLRVEIEKKEQWQLIDAIINNNPSLIYAFDRDGKCLLANTQLLKLLEKNSLEDVKGMSREALMSAKDAKAHFKNDGIVYATKETVSYEETFEKNGKTYQFLSYKFPLKNFQEEIYAVGGISIDMTEKHQYEESLQLAMRVFSQGNEGIMICNAANQIEFVNEAFEQITGFSLNDVLGKNPNVLASGRHDKSFYENMWASIIEQGHWRGEIWNKRKSGDIYPENLSISVVHNKHAEVSHYLGVFSDISTQLQAEEEIHNLAYYDSLTGCANRSLLQNIIEQKIVDLQGTSKAFALLFLDLDHFKEVNDVYGHSLGDLLLKSVTKRISNIVRQQDTVSRLGGDEFVVLLSDVDESLAKHKAEQLIAVLVKPFVLEERQLNLSASIGIAVYPQNGEDYPTLLKNADAAMYQAKEQGRNTFRLYHATMTEVMRQRLSLDAALRHAIENKSLKLALQPQFCFSSQTMVGFEALLRWQHPTLGNITPDIFIPIAERTDLIVELSNWVLHESLSTLQKLQQFCPHACRVSVNISAKEFVAQDFVDRISTVLKMYPDIAPESLELELTERIVMNDVEAVQRVFIQLRKMGVRLALDDFGTGYSSLSALKNLPVNLLKIDMSFVKNLKTNTKDQGICDAVIAIAEALDLETIAEGVETQYQYEYLKKQGTTLAQGYLCGKPVFFPELLDWVKKQS